MFFKSPEQKAGEAAMRVSCLFAEEPLTNSWNFYFENEESINRDIADFVLDEAIFSMHLLDRLAFATVNDRQFFINVLAAGVAPHLLKASYLTIGDGIDQLVEMCNQRQKEWGGLSLHSRKSESLDNWLFMVAAIGISASSNAVFLTRFVDRLVTRFEVLQAALKVAYP